MTVPALPQIRPIRAATGRLLSLNNENATQLSPLTLAEFAHLIAESFYAAAIDEADALLLALDQAADYDSPNFLWFRERYGRFVYVDRIVIAFTARGRGYARALYCDLFARAQAAAHSRVVCEVNFEPPNPVSDAFHAALGFAEVGRAAIQNHTKTVRYLLRNL
jgi:predicted GNAT superfamily acetyltransferase